MNFYAVKQILCNFMIFVFYTEHVSGSPYIYMQLNWYQYKTILVNLPLNEFFSFNEKF